MSPFLYIEVLNSDKFHQCYPYYGLKGTAVIGNPTLYSPFKMIYFITKNIFLKL